MKHTITITSGKYYVVSCSTDCYQGTVTTDWRVAIEAVQRLVGALMFDMDGEDICLRHIVHQTTKE